MPDPVEIRLARAGDMADVCDLVNHYVATSLANFRTEPQVEADWAAAWSRHHERYPWLVAVPPSSAGSPSLVGVAYASPYSDRGAYAWFAETTVYVRDGATGTGVGRALYSALVQLLDAQGFTTQLGAISLPNPGSVALHEATGFVRTGLLRSVGYKFGTWCDVVLYQRTPREPDATPSDLRPVADVAHLLTMSAGCGPAARVTDRR